MEENSPRYSHTKYEKFFISGCRVISNQKPSKENLVIKRVNGQNHTQMDGWMDGWKDERIDEQTNRMDENYIPLQHTSYAGGINIRIFKELNQLLIT